MSEKNSTSDDAHARYFEIEVKRVHAFFEVWFRGEIPRSNERFDSELTNNFHRDMKFIPPSGEMQPRDQLLEDIGKGYGSNQNFKVAIRDLQILPVKLSPDLVVVSYIEHQQGAKNTEPPDNLRLATVIFRTKGSARPTWLHIHETALPVSKI